MNGKNIMNLLNNLIPLNMLLGMDVSELIGVKKYEAPVPVELAGQVSGNFPAFIRKTDQERCQNIGREIFQDNSESCYEVSMKLDGTSFTTFWVDNEQGVCSRNWELKVNEANGHNTLVRMYLDSKLHDVLAVFRRNIAIQGELMGPGIQANRESLQSHKLFVFDIYDIDLGCYISPTERAYIMQELFALGLDRDFVAHVPILHTDVTLAELGITTTPELLKFAEGPSISNPIREGLVFKRMDGGFSFKAISNDFLIREK